MTRRKRKQLSYKQPQKYLAVLKIRSPSKHVIRVKNSDITKYAQRQFKPFKKQMHSQCSLIPIGVLSSQSEIMPCRSGVLASPPVERTPLACLASSRTHASGLPRLRLNADGVCRACRNWEL